MAIADALSRPEVGEGVRWGLVVVGVVTAGASVSWAAGRRPRGWPVAGLAAVVAAWLALRQGVGVPPQVLAGLCLLGLGALAPRPWRFAAVLPGALVLAGDVPAPLPGWAAPLVALTTIAVAVVGPKLEADHHPGLGPVLMAAAALGGWACVPDVEHIAPVASAFTVVGAAASLWPRLRLGLPYIGPAAGLVLWAAAEGAQGRPASLVGTAAGLGLFVVLPAARWLRRSSRPRLGGQSAVAVVLGQLALVALTSRVAGAQTGVGGAVIISASVLVCAALVSAGLGKAWGARRRGDPSSAKAPAPSA